MSAIEVHPAATREIHPEVSGPAPSDDPRDDTIAIIGRTFIGPDSHDPADATADELDAALCVVAGVEPLVGSAAPPEDTGLAEREGWIWVRRSDDARART